MNFKLTKYKTIISIAIPIIIFIIISQLPKMLNGNKIPNLIQKYLAMYDLSNLFGIGNIAIIIIEALIIYLIWSLIQEKV